MSNISGYTGLFKQPIQNPVLYGPTVYCISDNDKNEAIFILLSPQAFLDVYNIAKSPSIINAKLVVPSLDVIFISDIFNLFMALKPIKPELKWIFPECPPITTSLEFELGHEKMDNYIHPHDFDLSISFIKNTNFALKNVYDIIVRDGEKVRYIAQYIDDDKAKILIENLSIDEIHVPYSSTIYGGLSYSELIALYPDHTTKFVVNSFASISEYEYCKNNSKIRIGRLCYNDIV